MSSSSSSNWRILSLQQASKAAALVCGHTHITEHHLILLSQNRSIPPFIEPKTQVISVFTQLHIYNSFLLSVSCRAELRPDVHTHARTLREHVLENISSQPPEKQTKISASRKKLSGFVFLPVAAGAALDTFF